MIAFALGAAILLSSFIVLWAMFSGIGLLVRRACGLTFPGPAFWTGFGIGLLILIVWSLFLPVGGWPFVIIGAAGLVGIVSCIRRIGDSYGVELPGLTVTLVAIVAALWVTGQALGNFQSWDGGLYHIQSVQWAKMYAAVPGLANLHGPLGFNQVSFLYDAMIDSGWWQGRGFHLANGLLVFVMLLQSALAGMRFARGAATRADLFRFCLIAPTLRLANNGDIASYSTDVPLTLVLLYTASVFYELMDPSMLPVWRADPNERRYRLISLAILLCAAVCVKLNVGLFAALALPLAIYSWRTHDQPDRARFTTTLVTIGAIIAVFAIPWLVRGVILSGYPLFPLPIAGLPVDWRVPLEHARAELAYISFTEREFSWELVGRGWVKGVFEKDVYSVLVPSCVAAIAAAILWVRHRQLTRLISRHATFMLLPVLVSIAAWLVTAPSLRYSPALFWILAAVLVCELWRDGPSVRLERPSRLVVTALVLLGVSPLVVQPALGAVSRGENPVTAVLTSGMILAPHAGVISLMRQPPEVTPFTTTSGLVLNVPKRMPGPETFVKCWNAPLPCTANPAPNLRLRKADDLSRGFQVDGNWQMQDWPYYWQDTYLAEWRRRHARGD